MLMNLCLNTKPPSDSFLQKCMLVSVCESEFQCTTIIAQNLVQINFFCLTTSMQNPLDLLYNVRTLFSVPMGAVHEP